MSSASRIVLSLLTSLVWLPACEPSKPPLEASVKRVERTQIVFDVKTEPGVSVGRTSPEVKADENGRAELKMSVPEEGKPNDLKDPAIFVKAYSFPILGDPERVASQRLGLDFDPMLLRNAPEDPEKPVLTFVNYLKPSDPRCVRIDLGEQGRGYVGSQEGAAFMGPAGARVTIGEDVFEIPSSRIGIWEPSGQSLISTLEPSFVLGTDVELKVESGDTTVTQEASVKLEDGCKSRLGEAARQAVEGDVEWNPKADFGLVARLDGDFLVVGLTEWHRRDDARMDNARFVATEEEVSREKAARCTKYHEGLRYKRGGRVEVGSFRPEMVTTRVRIHELPSGEVLAEKTFSPEEDCERTVYPRSAPIDRWVWKVLDEG